jgi:arginase family enzyme
MIDMHASPAIHVLDLDGSLLPQKELLTQPRLDLHLHSLQTWGPRVRLVCGFRRFRKLMATVAPMLSATSGTSIIFPGSGDFHHVSLGLIERLTTACNLLVLDAHPDWMRGLPILHCGTWLYHAARLPAVVTVYHLGGQTDFDNRFSALAPWRLLQNGKIKVISAARRFTRGRWKRTEHESLRPSPSEPASPQRIETIVRRFGDDLAARPLYISIDKDVLCTAEAVTNWDSGCLTLAEVTGAIRCFQAAARGRLIGADIVGDWSPVRARGVIARASHHLEHPCMDVHPAEAAILNQRANLALLAALLDGTA